MKKVFRLAVVGMIVIAGCKSGGNTQSNPGGYIINGTISNKDSGWAYLGHEDSTGFVQDSTRIKDHKFTFMGKVAEPAMYYLMVTMGGDAKPLPFFIEDTTIQISGNKDSIQNATITGSASEALYEAYRKMMMPLKMRQQAVYKSYDMAYQNKDKATMDSLEKVAEQMDKEEHDATIAYAVANPSSIIGAWAIAKSMLFDPNLEQLHKAFNAFTPTVQKSKYGKKIKETIDIAERLAPGQPAPEFTLSDTAGKPVALSSFHGKYVLVDFWASWCGPCRRENPNVVAAYGKYKSKNFTILGVSLDDQKEPWLKAIHADGLHWNQVSDLKGWQSAAAAMYGIKSIPSNFLLDPDGKIIGHNLRGDALEEALAKALK
ncbi:MAG TPA: TlpA disulfide reductase family protein [Bacteroidia bacterium]|jgi:peroxiredoxin|nr:TlpA disulfide reductase family protein [Bacteroidia bacterium]